MIESQTSKFEVWAASYFAVSLESIRFLQLSHEAEGYATYRVNIAWEAWKAATSLWPKDLVA